MHCPGVPSVLVETRGLGTWQPVEVYRCEADGVITEHAVQIEENHE